MFVVCVNSVGAEILLRIEPEYPWRLALVLLRCGTLDSFKSNDGFARRVVKARAKDILAVACWLYAVHNSGVSKRICTVNLAQTYATNQAI